MNQNKKVQNFLDLTLKKSKSDFFDFSMSGKIIENNLADGPKSILFSKGERTDCFFTEDSKLYITPREKKLMEKGIKLNCGIRKWDSLSRRIEQNYRKFRPGRQDFMQKIFAIKYATFRSDLAEGYFHFIRQFSFPKLWNATVVVAILIGMVSMTFIYRYLGEEAVAEKSAESSAKVSQEKIDKNKEAEAAVLGAEETKRAEQAGAEYIGKIIDDLNKKKKDELEKEIKEIVKGYPIEKMVPYIAEKDRIVAAFVIGIARKESTWGKHVPVLNGEDCYNYWGYRGIRPRMGTGGHTCFDSPKDAVDTVSKRIEFLVSNKKLDTPGKMVIWKCGSDCKATGGYAAAQKWISDVDFYFKKLNK